MSHQVETFMAAAVGMRVQEVLPTDYQVVGVIPSWSSSTTPGLTTSLPGGGWLELPGVTTKHLASLTLITFSRMTERAPDATTIDVELYVGNMSGLPRDLENRDEFFPVGMVCAEPQNGDYPFGQVIQLFMREL
jgi:hypothetical protein